MLVAHQQNGVPIEVAEAVKGTVFTWVPGTHVRTRRV
jgi:hypothetical protein